MKETTVPIFDKRLLLFAGAYGSGKTEVAVNYAMRLATTQPKSVAIIDLDIVNPYFRSREAGEELEAYGVRVITPHNEQCHADLPIILPDIRSAIERSDGIVVIDVGGDDVGARVLSSMTDAFTPQDYEFFMVLNAKRPFTSDAAGSLKMMRDIESSSRLKFTGIVSNTHLIGETNPEIVYDGYRLAAEVGKKAGIPVAFVSVIEEVAEKLDPKIVDVCVFALTRQMLKPWEHKQMSILERVAKSQKA